MPVEIIPQRPYAQCCICYRPAVDKVCHHCGRAMCDKASCKSTLLPRESLLPNTEFNGLGLDEIPGQPLAIHCEQCVEKIHGKNLFWRLFNTILGRNRPPLPTRPIINGVSITETIQDQIRLDAEGEYTVSEVKPREGELKISLQFVERERARQQAYCRRFRIKAGEDFPFHAGFAVLEGTSRWQPNLVDKSSQHTIDMSQVPVDTIVLQGNINELSFFNDATSPANAWEPSFTYRFTNAEGKAVALPIQIIPTLVPDGTHRTLELVVQLRPDAEFEAARIDDFTVVTPQAWGQIVKTAPAVRINQTLHTLEEGSGRKVAWKGLNIDTDKAQDRRRSFFISLQNQIEPTMHLRGKLKLTLKGTASGLKGVKLFYAWGRQRTDFTVKRQTRVEIDFDLCLEKLRFQTVGPEPVQQTFPGASLNHNVMNELTRSLNQAGLYVRRVVENPARTSKANAYVTNQSWHIHGRNYIGAYPLDFHLVVTGQAHSIRASDSEVQVDITVRGVVAQPEMYNEMVTLRDQLLEEVTRILNNSVGANNQRQMGFRRG